MENTFNLMKSFLALGELTENENTSISEKVKYKQRIVFATMRNLIPNWEAPRDWDLISDEMKLERLIKIEKTVWLSSSINSQETE
jgi:hypothetical protein